MIKKRSPFEFESDYGPKTQIVDLGDEYGINKLASRTHIPNKLASAMAEIKQNPDPDFSYMYDRALGAGEVYGPNNNGDWFGKEALQKHHDSFVKEAYLFRHHNNKDPKNKVGDIIESEYNDMLDTVDLLTKAPTEKVKEDLQKLEDGHVLATSMGAKVKHDVCSICSNKASSRISYCGHLRNNMLKIYPDGRQVYAKNPKPRFVDLSIVTIPADPSSAVLEKIASLSQPEEKTAEMEKKDPGFSAQNTLDGEDRGVIRPEVIEATNNLSRGEAISTLHDAKGELRPDEFQAVMEKDASLLRPNTIPVVSVNPVPQKSLGGTPLYKLAHHIEKIGDVPLEKTASVNTANFLKPHEKKAYLMYRKAAPGFSRKFLR